MLHSFLFVPGDSQRKIEKAAGGTADAVILDLEDAVAPSKKEIAREVVAQALSQIDFGGKTVLVRSNGIGTPFAQADLEMLRGVNIDGVMLPKVETADMMIEARTLLGARPIYALIESALGVLNLPQIVTAVPDSLAGLAFGAEDYVASVGATTTAERHEVLFARSAVVNGAAAVGVPAIDAVFTDFHNVEGLQVDTLAGKQLGFSGKMVIHPKQAVVVNELFAVDPAERAQAQELVDAYNRYLAQGIGVFSYNGKMVDEAIVRRARQIVES